MGRSLRNVMVAALGALLCASVAIAITYGWPDGTLHPNVGALILGWSGQKYLICSGTLIAPTVFLTAAHCVAYLEQIGASQVWVTFDTEFTPNSPLISVTTMVKHPDYNWRMSDPKDIAVVVLSSAPAGLAPAGLPTEGLLDDLAKSHALKGRRFEAVGYGGQAPAVGGGPPRWEYRDIREYATSTFLALKPAWLQLSQNPARDDGGACYGDSGGPNFFGSMIAGITVTGDVMCRATNVTYRLDTPAARAFLAPYVTP